MAFTTSEVSANNMADLVTAIQTAMSAMAIATSRLVVWQDNDGIYRAIIQTD